MRPYCGQGGSESPGTPGGNRVRWRPAAGALRTLRVLLGQLHGQNFLLPAQHALNEGLSPEGNDCKAPAWPLPVPPHLHVRHAAVARERARDRLLRRPRVQVAHKEHPSLSRRVRARGAIHVLPHVQRPGVLAVPERHEHALVLAHAVHDRRGLPSHGCATVHLWRRRRPDAILLVELSSVARMDSRPSATRSPGARSRLAPPWSGDVRSRGAFRTLLDAQRYGRRTRPSLAQVRTAPLLTPLKPWHIIIPLRFAGAAPLIRLMRASTRPTDATLPSRFRPRA